MIKYIFILYMFTIFPDGYCQENISKVDLFNIHLSDSIEKYIFLNQNDVILSLYVEIHPLSKEFIECINCKGDGLLFLNLDLLKESFFSIIGKEDCELLTKEYKYFIQINSIHNIYHCKFIE